MVKNEAKKILLNNTFWNFWTTGIVWIKSCKAFSIASLSFIVVTLSSEAILSIAKFCNNWLLRSLFVSSLCNLSLLKIPTGEGTSKSLWLVIDWFSIFGISDSSALSVQGFSSFSYSSTFCESFETIRSISFSLCCGSVFSWFSKGSVAGVCVVKSLSGVPGD